MKVTKSFRALIPRLLFVACEICSSTGPVHRQTLAGWFNLVPPQLQGTCKNMEEMFSVERAVPCFQLEHDDWRGKTLSSRGRGSQERAL